MVAPMSADGPAARPIVLLPTYNERENLEAILDAILDHQPDSLMFMLMRLENEPPRIAVIMLVAS